MWPTSFSHLSYFYTIIGIGGVISLTLCISLLRYATGLIIPIVNCLSCFCVNIADTETPIATTARYTKSNDSCSININKLQEGSEQKLGLSAQHLVKPSGHPPYIVTP